ncbi:MAG: hypothetical protein F6K54_06630 [Okeania sp. SIO3B5]|uniref:hypothetical protein n=1 Tax=Okeania sp. SIO3B5 TaxID=2607811 RepID=UPI0014003F9B|nr:hypothetical protein [Okeania sp. SIO3B5]NEO52779.1 hypothetical protein [Okeania sp. SIO3B5]
MILYTNDATGHDIKPILTDNQSLPYKNRYEFSDEFSDEDLDLDLDSNSSNLVSLTVEDFQERKLKILRQIEL